MISIHVLLQKIVQEYSDNEKFLQSYVEIMWERLVGKDVARQTKIVELKQNTLVISVYDSHLHKILAKMEGEILQKINSLISKPLIAAIHFRKSRKFAYEKSVVSSGKREKSSVQLDNLKEATLIADDELRENFKKAYHHYQKMSMTKKK
ncbi:MAG: hypothetical protein A2Y62_15885 [Candidatus Fischerbacteria bacterium RBG_13_37_8]|uniref:DUF721 domain-containing protein n=1 Tax=Candidatus Fischerbacteria bacterium RBG_13_37_8 TaxID=1817863 RepID=A0A1F5VTP2_9BACT|nr:MAG: hypothetical protein A2Y62_15885 [Candidatus Fischerbacteria bacterium RBG_13_37_8]